MGPQNDHRSSGAAWALIARQHGVISRRQLLELGFGPEAIKHRIAKRRLHPIHRGVYAVGRPDVTRHGRWMAAVLACGSDALLSHGSAAELWGIRSARPRAVHVSVPARSPRRPSGLVVHRLAEPGDATAVRDGIPVTSVVCTIVDLAAGLGSDEVERAINEADKCDLIDPDALRAALDHLTRRPGLGSLREILDRRTFTLTDSELESRFLPIARRAGLSLPQTGRWLNGFKVDFYWPDLGLVVETDGLRYHRTPAEQARDRLRDQAHTAAGLTPVRFTRAQVRYEPRHVEAVLAAVARRLGARQPKKAAAAS